MTAETSFVSDSTVACMQRGKKGKEKGNEKVFLSPTKHINIPKRVTDLDNFPKDVLH